MPRLTHLNPNGWTGSVMLPTMLGMLLAFLLCGCASTDIATEKKLSADARDARSSDSIEQRAQAEQHPPEPQPQPFSQQSPPEPLALAQPKSQFQPVKRIDPGAAYIAEIVSRRIESRQVHQETESTKAQVIVSVSSIRNQSRAHQSEFNQFLERFAQLLSDGSSLQHVSFTANAETDSAYHLRGTAYLLSADGFDWWELFVSLHRSNHETALWRCEYPVRVMRHPRPEHQQVFLVPLPRIRN